MYIFPSTWNGWPVGKPVDVWAFSDADEVELLLNGVSLGRQAMPTYSHVTWTVPYAPGALTGLAYRKGVAAPLASYSVNTTGAPAALRLSVKDGVGAAGLYAGCNDVALVQVEVVDASGLVVPFADTEVTFAVDAASPPGAAIAGTSNGDPSCLVNNLSPTRPAFHGLLMAVVRAGSAPGTITVTASADGFAPQKLALTVTAPDFTDPSVGKWCFNGATL
jgi:beta-galactosidase